jgi:acetyl esterase/lipase
LAWSLALLWAGSALAQVETPYDRKIDVVYATNDGVDFHMDIFVPNGKARLGAYHPNDNGKGLGIIDVVSGAWHTDRGKLDDHEKAQFYNIFCARGYTVFAIRPGSRPDYTALDMVSQIKQGIRWVKAHSAEYGVDPERLGMTGASAGAHLALLTMTTAEEGDPKAADLMLHFGTQVKAVGVFFPPTDFLEWEGKDLTQVGELVGDILFKGGVQGHTDEELRAAAAAASPREQIKGQKLPPVLIFHGDADPLVPLQQSQLMVESLKAAGNQAELIVKPGGGHPWLTIPEEVLKLADWFDKQLASPGK